MLSAILYWLNTEITMAGSAGAVRAMAKRIQPFPCLAKSRSMILTALIKQDFVDETTRMLDSATVKVHQRASEVKKGDSAFSPIFRVEI